jgi:hypothetical protein
MPKPPRRNLADVLAADSRAKQERRFLAAAPAQRRRAPDVQLGARIPADLAERLRATVQLRHAAGLHPFTAGGIITAALMAWLDLQADGGADTPRQLAQQLRVLADRLDRRKA